MYRLTNLEAPNYLLNLLPNRVHELSDHNLRNNQNFNLPFTRLCSFETSFFPSSIKLWNELDLQVRNSSSLSQFKQRIRNRKVKVNSFLTSGERATEIALTRIRHNCSSLKADHFRVNIIANPNCDCGHNFETAQHYFFECRLYNIQRNRLISSLSRIPRLNLDVLLHGNQSLNEDTNQNILFEVYKFIKDSRRFSQ